MKKFIDYGILTIIEINKNVNKLKSIKISQL